MKLLLTGATGYIGKRLLPALVHSGHEVVCCVRDRARFHLSEGLEKRVTTIEVDFLDEQSLGSIPEDIEAAFYLIHSMSMARNYQELELQSARNFRQALEKTNVAQAVYLSGIVNENSLSKHLASRKAVENELAQGQFHLTTLRAGIIIGSGSASFEIIRDLVEKLPVMVAPKWLKTRCQPIGVVDVVEYLCGVLNREECYDQSYDIGGPEVLTYRELLIGFARQRNLWRKIFIVPVMTPRLSSYWLYFITSTSYRLASALVDSMSVEVICRENDLSKKLAIRPMRYQKALERAFSVIQENKIASSWKDSAISGRFESYISDFLNVPTFGCFLDRRSKKYHDRVRSVKKIWRIGGDTGWYYATWLWKLRGFIDLLSGGVGLRRGRSHPTEIHAGDAIDFWRVLYADEDQGRLLLFAEMRLPGEAWLEFRLNGDKICQTATFRPRGVWGRLYWYSVWPLHGLIFGGMLKALAR